MKGQWCLVLTAYKSTVIVGPFKTYEDAKEYGREFLSSSPTSRLRWKITNLYTQAEYASRENYI